MGGVSGTNSTSAGEPGAEDGPRFEGSFLPSSRTRLIVLGALRLCAVEPSRIAPRRALLRPNGFLSKASPRPHHLITSSPSHLVT